MNLEQPEIIQILRRRSGMNQGSLGAKAFNTSYESGRTKIKNIELGKQIPTPEDIQNMARVLGVPAEAFIPQKPQPSQPANSKEGVWVHPKTLDRFPQLGQYLDMLNKAVALNDQELMAYIGEKTASILQTPTRRMDEKAANP